MRWPSTGAPPLLACLPTHAAAWPVRQPWVVWPACCCRCQPCLQTGVLSLPAGHTAFVHASAFSCHLPSRIASPFPPPNPWQPLHRLAAAAGLAHRGGGRAAHAAAARFAAQGNLHAAGALGWRRVVCCGGAGLGRTLAQPAAGAACRWRSQPAGTPAPPAAQAQPLLGCWATPACQLSSSVVSF